MTMPPLQGRETISRGFDVEHAVSIFLARPIRTVTCG